MVIRSNKACCKCLHAYDLDGEVEKDQGSSERHLISDLSRMCTIGVCVDKWKPIGESWIEFCILLSSLPYLKWMSESGRKSLSLVMLFQVLVLLESSALFSSLFLSCWAEINWIGRRRLGGSREKASELLTHLISIFLWTSSNHHCRLNVLPHTHILFHLDNSHSQW